MIFGLPTAAAARVHASQVDNQKNTRIYFYDAMRGLRPSRTDLSACEWDG